MVKEMKFIYFQEEGSFKKISACLKDKSERDTSVRFGLRLVVVLQYLEGFQFLLEDFFFEDYIFAW